MSRAPLIVTLILLVSCGQEAEQPAQTTAEAPSTSEVASSVRTSTDADDPSAPFFVGRWASDEANCREASWLITADELQTAGEVTCRFQRTTPTASGFDVDATCFAEGPPEQWAIKFAYAQSARALLIEDAPFNDIGLVRCDDSANAPVADEASAKSPRGAAHVLRHYYDLLTAKRFDDASQLWTPSAGEDAMGSSEQNVVQYASYDVGIGEPGRIEGAAGSLYISIPVRAHATRKTGEEVRLSGEATLRRVNDVPGATPEQLSWRIMRIEWQPQAR